MRSRPRRRPPDAEAPVGRSAGARSRPACGSPLQCTACPSPNPSRGSPLSKAVHIAPTYPQRWASSLGRRGRRVDAVGVSRILICTMLLAALSRGPLAVPGAAGPGMGAASPGAAPATPTGQAALTPQGGVAGSEPTDRGETPQLRFGWPLPGFPTVVRAFRPPAFRYGPGHRGVDLAATAGAPVLAAGAGTVVFAGTVAGRGVVSVDHSAGDHSGGLRTTYEPVSPTVTAGDRVLRGERIGTVQPGHPGCPVAACLHWGALRAPEHDRDYLDPLQLLAAIRVRLLPIDDPEEPAIPRGRQPAEASSILLRSRNTALVCSWHTRDSVTPSTRPISARVRFSK